MLKIRGALLEAALERAQGRFIADVRVGLSYTALCLDDGALGVALNLFRGQHSAPFEQPMQGLAALKLLELLPSSDPIQAALGLATLNALVNNSAPAQPGDLMEILELRPDDRVAMVGHFRPLLPRLQARVAEIQIYQEDDPELLPPEAAPEGVAHSTVALITASALLNGSLPALLEAASGCRECVLLGPTTPLLSQAFKGSSLTLLSGIQIPAPEPILGIVSEGGGMQRFKQHVSKVCLRI